MRKSTEQATDISLGHGSDGGNSEERNTEKKWPYTSSFRVFTMGIFYFRNLKNKQLRYVNMQLNHINHNSKHVRFSMSPSQVKGARKYSLLL